MHNKRQCLIGIILNSQKGGQVSQKRGQKGGLGGARSKKEGKRRVWEDPPPPPPTQKEGSLAAMVTTLHLSG